MYHVIYHDIRVFHHFSCCKYALLTCQQGESNLSRLSDCTQISFLGFLGRLWCLEQHSSQLFICIQEWEHWESMTYRVHCKGKWYTEPVTEVCVLNRAWIAGWSFPNESPWYTLLLARQTLIASCTPSPDCHRFEQKGWLLFLQLVSCGLGRHAALCRE